MTLIQSFQHTNAASIYFFEPNQSKYEVQDLTGTHLSTLQKIKALAKTSLSEFQQMSAQNKVKNIFITGSFLSIGTSCGLLATTIGESVVFKSTNEQVKNTPLLFLRIASTACTNIALYGIISYRIFQRFEYATAIFSQNADYHAIIPYVSECFNELRNENPQLVSLWSKIKSFKSEQEIQKQIQGQIEKGTCFGYVLAILEQLEKGKDLTGAELLAHINAKTVIKKQLLEHLYMTLKKFLDSKNTILGSAGLNCIVLRNSDPMIPLDTGKKLQRTVVEAELKKAHDLCYQISGLLRINIAGSFISVAEGSDAIQNRFLIQMERDSFLRLDQCDLLNPYKSIRDCFNETYVPNTQDTATVHISQKKTLTCGSQSHYQREKRSKRFYKKISHIVSKRDHYRRCS
ncbi:MAG: hypothetical protein JWO53_783 [Chlamydiia bacterium]|nr:hypothetical protein [Chlamydiia bacterium]